MTNIVSMSLQLLHLMKSGHRAFLVNVVLDDSNLKQSRICE